MRGFVFVVVLVLLFLWGGPHVAVAFISVPILFVLAVAILAVWKILDSFKTKAG
jgi:hypothetical protein